MSHTKEPWRIGLPPPNGEQTIGDLTGMMVAVTTTGHGVESKENARRIVACVNACAGIPTDVLEDRSILKASADIMQQLDGLLAVIAEIEINADEVMEFDECVGMVVPIEDYKRLIEVAAKAKDEP